MSESQPTHHDAEIILKLYDLRREPVMREARCFVVQFAPKSLDEILKVANAFGTKEQAYLRQVAGYWEMAASLVNRRALNRELALDNFQEMFFVYAKIQPYLEEYRQTMATPNFLRQVQQLAESSPETRKRLSDTREMQAAMARRRAEATAGALA
jgi:hypothetical protein